MNDDEHRRLVLRAIAEYTERNIVSKDVARQALIRTGIYYEDGTLRPEYGGEDKEKRE